MNGTFCANFLLQLSSLPDLREFRLPLIVKCVFNSFFSYTAIILNIVTVYPMQHCCSVLLLLMSRLVYLLNLFILFGQVASCSKCFFKLASFLGVVAVILAGSLGFSRFVGIRLWFTSEYI